MKGEGEGSEGRGIKEGRGYKKTELTPVVLATSSCEPGNSVCILRADASGVTGSRSVLTRKIGALVEATRGIPVHTRIR